MPARPLGASWCGAHDLAGNVYELTDGGEALGGSFRTEPMEAFPERRRRDGMTALEAHFPDGRVEGVPLRYLIPEPQDDLGFRVALSAR